MRYDYVGNYVTLKYCNGELSSPRKNKLIRKINEEPVVNQPMNSHKSHERKQLEVILLVGLRVIQHLTRKKDRVNLRLFMIKRKFH